MSADPFSSIPSLRRKSDDLAPRLVPTRIGHSFRDTGMYASCERLPDVDLLLERQLGQLRALHESSERKALPFEACWGHVCDKLLEKGNATAFTLWKTGVDIFKNRNDVKRIDKLLANNWIVNPERFAELRNMRPEPKIKAVREDAIDIAVAYWIEAKNARDSGDRLRALHSLIECNLYVGVAISPRTESESKRDAGRQQGVHARDAIAAVAVSVLARMEIDSSITSVDLIYFRAVEIIEGNPEHAAILEAYDAQATAGKQVQRGSSSGARFAGTLRKWAAKRDSPLCAEIGVHIRRLRAEVTRNEKLAALKKSQRQAHS